MIDQSSGKLKVFLEIHLCSLFFTGSLFELLMFFLYNRNLVDQQMFNVYRVQGLRPDSPLSFLFLGIIGLVSGLCLVKFAEEGHFRLVFIINLIISVAIAFAVYDSFLPR